ncbi:lasso peptide biosynthesis B2 protein [Streptomyces yangpuensis]|uniref:lasso peptide biosynthesis B2 protein n=1 Tax=Streptomyces yangpuensis TaxID=1648182 RepID=UPI00382A5199
MSKNLVAVVLPASCVVLDYRSGRTELHTIPPKGALTIQHQEDVPSWGTIEVAAALTRVPAAPWTQRLAAVPVLLATAVVAHAGPRSGKFHRLVRLAGIGRGLPRASKSRVRDAVNAIRWASRVMPARWACLEQSTAAAVLMAASGLRAEWRHGIAGDPVRMHAWIADSDGRPVEEPPDTALYAVTYTPDGPPLAEGRKGAAS